MSTHAPLASAVVLLVSIAMLSACAASPSATGSSAGATSTTGASSGTPTGSASSTAAAASATSGEATASSTSSGGTPPSATGNSNARSTNTSPPATSGSSAATVASTNTPPPSTSGSTAPSGEASPPITITWEKPYKYGERPVPKSKEAYLADIRERRRWNDGGTGKLLAPLPGPDGHPDPRVIVDIERVRGGHDRKALLRLARRNHWINVVRCYRLGAYKDQQMRGRTRARVDIDRSGNVRGARLLESELPDQAVAQCMADKLTNLKMPSATSGSRVWVSMRVGPGDEPQPPPKDELEPGSGQLDEPALIETLQRAMPQLSKCYRDAFAYAPELWGRIVVRLHITRRGKVDEAFQGESRFPDAKMLQCVLKAARRWSFAKPKGGALRFEIPLRFSNPKSEAR